MQLLIFRIPYIYIDFLFFPLRYTLMHAIHEEISEALSGSAEFQSTFCMQLSVKGRDEHFDFSKMSPAHLE